MPHGPSVPSGLETPALVVDVTQLRTNIEAMADAMRSRGVGLRPHAKTHKCPEIAGLQRDAGAAGLTVATLGEAEVFADAGFDDLFIAYPLCVRPDDAARLRALSGRAHLRVGVESRAGASRLAGAVANLSVVVEIDCGQHRTGVSPPEVVPLAQACTSLGLEVAGVFTHAGHSYSGPAAVESAATQETDAVSESVERLRDAGFSPEVASAGSTPTAARSARGAVNEERPGTYVFYDRQQVGLGTCRRDQVAAYVAATVVSSRPDGSFVLDAGSKALSSDRPAWLEGFGWLPEWDDAVVVGLSEHHGVVRAPTPRVPPVGDVVAVVPNHICTAVNLFDRLIAAEGDEIADVWEVTARGR